MAEEIKVVDLMAKNPTTKKVDVLVPYTEIIFDGGLAGGGHTGSDGKIRLNGKPAGAVKLDGFAHGEAHFEDNGDLNIDTSFGAWVTERPTIGKDSMGNPIYDDQVLNIFRRLK